MAKTGWKVKELDKVIQTLVKGVQIFGEEVFAKSQVYVPVDEGTLKESGTFELLPTGWKIVYRTSYAARQEFGLEPGHTEIVKRHPVKSHIRKPGIRVRAHHRPKTAASFKRVFEKGYEGKFYLTKAWEEVMPKLSEYITDLYRRSQ